MKIPDREWFRQMWPFGGARHALAGDYATIGAAHKHFLADVALRGGVFRAFDPKFDRNLDEFNGRRELALEIIKLCRLDPQQLFGLMAEKPREDKS